MLGRRRAARRRAPGCCLRERSAAADRLVTLGFLAGADTAGDAPAILVATAAGEVGVDLDADDMVADLVRRNGWSSASVT
ncbi:MAG: hypothetical protein U5R48_15530 [Gammaproteobacteria bacterium]|nr:hypothetical protein [Gammaproteobacteria bacterium]